VTLMRLSFVRDIWGGGSHATFVEPLKRKILMLKGEDGYGRRIIHQEQQTVEGFNGAEVGVADF
jgi:hypothetical protein